MRMREWGDSLQTPIPLLTEMSNGTAGLVRFLLLELVPPLCINSRYLPLFPFYALLYFISFIIIIILFNFLNFYTFSTSSFLLFCCFLLFFYTFLFSFLLFFHVLSFHFSFPIPFFGKSSFSILFALP